MFFWKKKKESSSSSGAWNKWSREILLFLAGLTLTLSAIFLARHRIAAVEREIRVQSSPVEIVVPSVLISAGEVFSEQNLAKKTVPASGTSNRNVPASEYELLVGARAKGNLAAGEPVLWSDVEEPFDMDKFSQVVPAGRRALTIEADVSSSFAGLIRPGDRVDLLCDGENGKTVKSWIRAVPVISVDRHYNRPPSGEESKEISTITVSVTPEEGITLASGARGGRLHWFLRNPDEPSRPATRNARISTTFRKKVEIWKAGILEPVPLALNGDPG
ncbi:MAG: Flp pilus assembly protein CpaB [Deltaproteobacteria bacterium]|nr:Flp pilus assembly protein CpaB [Deltaproteobacteria bacterium]